MKAYNVFRAENRAGGREQHVGQVTAHDVDDAQYEAEAQFECRITEHLYVEESELPDPQGPGE